MTIASGNLIGAVSTNTSIGKHTATIRIYKKDEVDWSSVSNFRDTSTSNIIISATWEKTIVSEDDGTFDVKLVPGEYDILIDRPGYADWIVKAINVQKDQTADVGLKSLMAGDVSKDGKIDVTDINNIKMQVWKNVTTATGFAFPSENYDFDDTDIVDVTELNAVKYNYDAVAYKYKVEVY